MQDHRKVKNKLQLYAFIKWTKTLVGSATVPGAVAVVRNGTNFNAIDLFKWTHWITTQTVNQIKATYEV